MSEADTAAGDLDRSANGNGRRNQTQRGPRRNLAGGETTDQDDDAPERPRNSDKQRGKRPKGRKDGGKRFVNSNDSTQTTTV